MNFSPANSIVVLHYHCTFIFTNKLYEKIICFYSNICWSK